MLRYAIHVAVIACLSVATANAAEFRGLGGFPRTHPFSFPYDMSGDGRVVVGLTWYGDETNNNHAFRWSVEEGIVLIDVGEEATYGAIATAVNYDGSVVAGTNSALMAAYAITWTRSDGVVPIGSRIDPTARFLGVTDISYDGQTLVGSAVGEPRAAIWNAMSGLLRLSPTLYEGHDMKAVAGSADGSVIVGFQLREYGSEAFRWTQQHGTTGLGSLSSTTQDSIASGISADGRVIVGGSASDSCSTECGEAFRWTNGNRSRAGELILC